MAWTTRAITHQRRRSHWLVGSPFARPEEVVGWLTAVQAQDYGGEKWGLGQRTASATDADIDRTFDDGAILRTHVLRPTWHFVRPTDLRWLLDLTAPRVHAANAYPYRTLELDAALLARSIDLLAAALDGGKHLTRSELAAVLAGGGVAASGLRLGYILMYAELDAVVCSGPRRGKQFTYALFDERVPPTNPLARDAALAQLAERFFAGHGPATARDFAWWSGLTMADATTGIDLTRPKLARAVVDGTTYWHALPSAVPTEEVLVRAHLLPNYDEFLIAYKDRAASFDPAVLADLGSDHDALQAHIIVLNGLVVGGWRRMVKRREVTITTSLIVPLDREERAAVHAAAEDYGRFLGMPVTVQWDRR